MTHFNLALLGFGNVGQAFARLLLAKQEQLRQEYDLSFTIRGIATARHGIALNENGIDIERALQIVTSDARLDILSSQSALSDAQEFIVRCAADMLIENTPVNYGNGQPAVAYLRTALEARMHAITANKGPVVHAYDELTNLARKVQRKFYFESAVMDGAPIFSLFRECLPVANLQGFSGILNSTTNLILTRMESGESLEKAIAYAQSIGITETDPSADIDGWDATIKVAALVTVLMGTPLKPSQVERQGIRGLSSDDIRSAGKQGQRWKLVCSARGEAGTIKTRVAPERVGSDSPLYGVNGTSSMITFEMDVLPQLSIIEGNPGPETTAYGLLADILRAAQ